MSSLSKDSFGGYSDCNRIEREFSVDVSMNEPDSEDSSVEMSIQDIDSGIENNSSSTNEGFENLEQIINNLNMEENSSFNYILVHLLRRASDCYQNLLREAVIHTIKEVLQKELKQFHHDILDAISKASNKNFVAAREVNVDSNCLTPRCTPSSPPQPMEPQKNFLDKMLKAAQISKEIKEGGDINEAFNSALIARDLYLVMAACRAADPAKVFGPPCRLKQPVLLSLTQQLATDMVHDTQLKCRYLEEAVINLNTADPITRRHLPLVVGEVHKHLKKFLSSYPNHLANIRIKLIVMATYSLLK